MMNKAYYTICYHSLGDMGGYLGLLIGASVMTICEVLDLIIYNILVKCTRGKKNKEKKEVEVNMMMK